MTAKLYVFPFNAMGSPCELKIYCLNKAQGEKVANKVMEDVHRIETRYSRYKTESVLSLINREAEQGGEIDVDDETLALLNYANTCYQQSKGLFDISSGVLRKAWNFKEQKIPKQEEIDKILRSVGWGKIKINGQSIKFLAAGMQLDFGGIGKEYAVDRAAAICQQYGIEHGLVNLGGDIKVIGPHMDGSPWQLSVAHPRKPGKILTKLEVFSGAVASSGDYERCIVINGKRYSHVLNPKTGWPVSGFASVTVVADQCVIAGSACTITMLMEKAGKKWLKKLGLRYIWVDQEGRVREG